jgi:hypothetical protein
MMRNITGLNGRNWGITWIFIYNQREYNRNMMSILWDIAGQP